jgi:hypothetical protein
MTLLNTDSYKLSHKGFMEPNTEVIYLLMMIRLCSLVYSILSKST